MRWLSLLVMLMGCGDGGGPAIDASYGDGCSSRCACESVPRCTYWGPEIGYTPACGLPGTVTCSRSQIVCPDGYRPDCTVDLPARGPTCQRVEGVGLGPEPRCEPLY